MCLLGGSISVLFATDRASQTKNYGIFWKAVEEGDKYPFCSPGGTSGTKWYTLHSKPKDFLICGACYSTIIYSFGGSRWFVPKSSSIFGKDTNLCAFNVAHSRYYTNFAAYIQAVLLGKLEPLANYSATVANVAPISTNIMGGGQGWQNQSSTPNYTQA